MTAIVEQRRYILSDVQTNNNKWWHIALYDNDDCITRWGRVGEEGQSKSYSGVGNRFFETKVREKEGKGYRLLRTLDTEEGDVLGAKLKVEEAAVREIEGNCPEVTDLIARLSRANVHNILARTSMEYDMSRGTFSTPLGVVTQDAITEARNLLTQIGLFVAQQKYDASDFIRVASNYLMLIPQNIGRSKPDLKKLYPDLEAVQAQNGLLDALEASLQSILSAPKTSQSAPERVFDLKQHRVETDTREFDRIRNKYHETRQDRHTCAHLDVKAVYRVEIPSMRREFEEKGVPLGNVWELWHGSKLANMLSILKAGLRVAPPRSAQITGKAFGNGTYFSDQSTKSLNYAHGYWDGKTNDNCFMLVCDVAMGNIYTPTTWGETYPHAGSDSTFAKASVSGLLNNEMIVYRDYQVNIKYLVEFDRKENCPKQKLSFMESLFKAAV